MKLKVGDTTVLGEVLHIIEIPVYDEKGKLLYTEFTILIKYK